MFLYMYAYSSFTTIFDDYFRLNPVFCKKEIYCFFNLIKEFRQDLQMTMSSIFF